MARRAGAEGERGPGDPDVLACAALGALAHRSARPAHGPDEPIGDDAPAPAPARRLGVQYVPPVGIGIAYRRAGRGGGMACRKRMKDPAPLGEGSQQGGVDQTRISRTRLATADVENAAPFPDR